MSTVGIGFAASDVGALGQASSTDVQSLGLLIAGRLDHFASRVPEVPQSSVEEMTLAVVETCNVIFDLAQARLAAAAHSVSQNLSKASRVLRAGQISQTPYNVRDLENIAAAVEEMLRGVDEAKQSL